MTTRQPIFTEGDGAVFDADRDRAGIDAEGFGSLLAGDDEAATAAEVRGNPPGITSTHVAANIRAARLAVGMDLRTMSDALGAAGRKLSPSGISKWAHGELTLTSDGLLAYWQQEWVQCLNRIQYFETGLLRLFASPSAIRAVVVLPEPFGPRNPVTRPGDAVKLTPLRTRLVP